MKILALLLLSLAAVDLLAPGLCIAEAPELPPLSSSSGSPLETGSGGNSIDDCFCCCAHIVAESYQAWQQAAEDVTTVAQAPRTLPHARAARLFHPPRV